MKIIFLDVDGVLNNFSTNAKSPNGYVGVSSGLVKRLKEIVKNTNAKIVLTSTWRENVRNSDEDGKYLIRQLKYKDIKIFDMIKGKSSSMRGWEIDNYLSKRNDIESFVILDDFDFDFYRYEYLISHFVNTDPKLGLTNEDVKSAINILNRKEENENV